MKGSAKISIFKYLQFFNPSVIYSRVKMRGLTSPIAIKIILCGCASLFVCYSNVESWAAPAQIAQVTSKSNINRPDLKVGSQGQPVSELQAALKLLGFYTGKVDGVYNNTTASAVSQFKQAVGLKPDGIVDSSTWQKLFPNEPSASGFPVPSQTTNIPKVANSETEQSSTVQTTTNTTTVNSNNEPKLTTRSTTTTTRVVNPSNEPKPATRTTARVNNPSNEPKPATRTTARVNNPSNEPKPATRTTTEKTPGQKPSSTRTPQVTAIQYTAAGLPILRPGMHGAEVVRLQQRLQKLGFFDGGIDGDFGVVTEAAVQAVQKRYGLEADGVVGGATWDILTRRR